MTVTDARTRGTSSLQEIRDAVRSDTASRAARHLRGDSTATGQLAHLRASQSRPLGDQPAAWSLVAAVVPASSRSNSEAPSAAEVAIHLAMSLAASHQQSQRTSMCNSNSLGASVAALRKALPDAIKGIDRTWFALLSSVDIEEVGAHLRRLIPRLRTAGIGLDYGRLAGDLILFTSPTHASSVRRRWGTDAVSAPTKKA